MNRKTAIVTGGSRGIGEAAAKLLAQNGCNVVLTYHENLRRAEGVAAAIIDGGGEAAVFRYDAKSSSDAEELSAFALKRYGKIDVLVNNAGSSLRALITETSDEDLRRVLDANLSGMFFLSRAVARDMIRRKQGAIVNISSIFGINGAALETAYSAAKAGVIGFTKALAKELAPSGISVNCVAPGAIDTEMLEFLNDNEREELCASIPMGRFGTPAEVAEAIVFLASSSYITGQILSPDGGATSY